MNRIALASLLLAPLLAAGCAPLVVGGAATGVAVVHDRRTAEAVLDDQAIELKVASWLAGDGEIKARAHVSVTSYNRIVLLTGEAPTPALRARAEAIARRHPKVRAVRNEIAVATPTTLGRRSRDALVTGRVKAALVGIEDLPGFDPTRVKVVTENGTVYLMGLLYRREADAVVARARGVDGVARIVRVFEYLD
ncbi:BON domain-containing protein [Inmirania thermothiophila]|uniref:Osmotically-inducible protein OsmY n=1 Tax=Inmirania thermothiophila TaxID=1750597 RepID=A0A3N1XSP8_9GAMM|nr:BON domain-containing protein [Inmirania thermothiophila]ROR29670.1 osmotically-inducible protein OsmY [Inmirania thermothiophila]